MPAVGWKFSVEDTSNWSMLGPNFVRVPIVGLIGGIGYRIFWLWARDEYIEIHG